MTAFLSKENFLQKFQKVPVNEFPNKVSPSPFLSVCVQTYQHENYIVECIEGILMQQTNFEVEILLGEDDSQDQTRNICLEYAKKFPEKIKLFLHKSENNILINGKRTGRFNLLYNLLSSSGKYIALCEGDDYWTDPLKLQKQVDFLEHNPEYAVCFHEVKTLNPDGLLQPYNGFTQDKTFSIEDLTQGNFIATASSVFRNYDHLKEMPEWFSRLSAGDWGLNMLNSTKGKIFFLQDCMAVYRLHNSGVWSSLGSAEMLEKGLQIMDNLNKAFDFKYDSLFQIGKERRIRKFSVPVETPRRSWLLSVKRKIKRVFT